MPRPRPPKPCTLPIRSHLIYKPHLVFLTIPMTTSYYIYIYHLLSLVLSCLSSDLQMEGATTGIHKRPRLEMDQSSPESPEAKRVRDDLLDILEDGDDNDRDAAWQDLASFMESFKEEVGLPEPPAQEPEPATDLSYLLEASDDDLGLPPAAVGEGEVGGGLDGAVVQVDDGWGLEGEVMGCEFGGWEEEEVDLGGFLDCYSDEMAAAADLSELPWHGESLAAV